MKKRDDDSGKASKKAEITLKNLDITTSDVISKEDITDVDFVINGLITRGINFLVSRPKCGKSTLAFQMAVAVSLGKSLFEKTAKSSEEQAEPQTEKEAEVANETESYGNNIFQCSEKQNVLLISFEENKAKFNKRLKNANLELIPDNIYFASSWPMLEGENGLELLKTATNKYKIKFIIVDTYALFFRGTKALSSTFHAEYNIISKLKIFADKNNIGILFLHHTTKQDSDDWLVSLYGSSALSAAADTILFIKKPRHQLKAILFVTGRDIEDQIYALKLDKDSALWEFVGQSDVFLLTTEQREIYESMLDLGKGGPIKLEDIASNIGKSKSNTLRYLYKMIEMGFVEKVGTGKYMAHRSPQYAYLEKEKNLFGTL